jgi:hypothetical protein
MTMWLTSRRPLGIFLVLRNGERILQPPKMTESKNNIEFKLDAAVKAKRNLATLKRPVLRDFQMSLPRTRIRA